MISNAKKFLKKFKFKFKQFNNTIRIVHKKTGQLRIVIFFDMIFSFILFGTSNNEYRIFEFYNIRYNIRKTYLTTRRHNRYYFYNKNILPILKNKEKLSLRLKTYLNTKIYNINEISFKDFELLALNNKKLIFRSPSASFEESYKIYDLKNFRSPAFMLDKAKKEKLYLVSDYFNQNKSFNEMSDELVILDIISIYANNKINIVASSIKFKDEDKIINGFVDIKNKCLKGHLKYENGKNYSKVSLDDKIPYFDKAIDFISEVALELSEIREIKWSVCIDNDGNIILMDANTVDDVIYYQIPEYLNRRVGLRVIYDKIMRKI